MPTANVTKLSQLDNKMIGRIVDSIAKYGRFEVQIYSDGAISVSFGQELQAVYGRNEPIESAIEKGLNSLDQLEEIKANEFT